MDISWNLSRFLRGFFCKSELAQTVPNLIRQPSCFPALLALYDRATGLVPGLDAPREAVDVAGEARTHQVLRGDAAAHAARAVDHQFLAVMGRNCARIEGGERDQR